MSTTRSGAPVPKLMPESTGDEDPWMDTLRSLRLPPNPPGTMSAAPTAPEPRASHCNNCVSISSTVAVMDDSTMQAPPDCSAKLPVMTV
eukprot:3211287-Prymnesium_polylepis.1